MRLSFLILMTLALLGTNAHASYRVYQLRLRHYDQTGKKKLNRTVLTLMDPKQYASFHGGPYVMGIEMLDTWYCPGDTSHKQYCKKPKEPVERAPASFDHPKRSKIPYNYQPVIP